MSNENKYDPRDAALAAWLSERAKSDYTVCGEEVRVSNPDVYWLHSMGLFTRSLDTMAWLVTKMTDDERAAMLACLHDAAGAWTAPLPEMLANLAFSTAEQRADAACRALGLNVEAAS